MSTQYLNIRLLSPLNGHLRSRTERLVFCLVVIGWDGRLIPLPFALIMSHTHSEKSGGSGREIIYFVLVLITGVMTKDTTVTDYVGSQLMESN
jgi:hypothetical protein